MSDSAQRDKLNQVLTRLKDGTSVPPLYVPPSHSVSPTVKRRVPRRRSNAPFIATDPASQALNTVPPSGDWTDDDVKARSAYRPDGAPYLTLVGPTNLEIQLDLFDAVNVGSDSGGSITDQLAQVIPDGSTLRLYDGCANLAANDAARNGSLWFDTRKLADMFGWTNRTRNRGTWFRESQLYDHLERLLRTHVVRLDPYDPAHKRAECYLLVGERDSTGSLVRVPLHTGRRGKPRKVPRLSFATDIWLDINYFRVFLSRSLAAKLFQLRDMNTYRLARHLLGLAAIRHSRQVEEALTQACLRSGLKLNATAPALRGVRALGFNCDVDEYGYLGATIPFDVRLPPYRRRLPSPSSAS